MAHDGTRNFDWSDPRTAPFSSSLTHAHAIPDIPGSSSHGAPLSSTGTRQMSLMARWLMLVSSLCWYHTKVRGSCIGRIGHASDGESHPIAPALPWDDGRNRANVGMNTIDTSNTSPLERAMPGSKASCTRTRNTRPTTSSSSRWEELVRFISRTNDGVGQSVLLPPTTQVRVIVLVSTRLRAFCLAVSTRRR